MNRKQMQKMQALMAQMSYVKKTLNCDEHIVHIASLHWIIFLPGMFMTCAGAALSFYSYDIAGYALSNMTFAAVAGKIASGIALAFTLFGFVLLLAAFVRQASTELAITDQRIIAKYGFISRSTYEIMVNRITGVNFDQTIIGRILGYGTILVHGAGGDVSPFHGVSEPQIFQESLMNVLQQMNRKEKGK